MTRIIKDYAVRRDEILDAAQRLVITRGYEQMTIQDILDELQIAKGTFYHYFNSKQAILEAIIERLSGAVEQLVKPIVHDPGLSAVEKFDRFFAAAAQWKNEQKPFMLALLRVWYTDENAIVREKLRAEGFKRLAPLMTVIVHQGVQEGVFNTSYPDRIGEVVMSLIYDISDPISDLLLSLDPVRDDLLPRLEGTFAAYTEAIERVLGASAGSLTLVEPEVVRGWVDALREHAQDMYERDHQQPRTS